MGKKKSEIKTFNMHMPHDVWMFLKKTAMEQEESMAQIIIRCITKYQKKLENRLTEIDSHV